MPSYESLYFYISGPVEDSVEKVTKGNINILFTLYLYYFTENYKRQHVHTYEYKLC